MRRIASVIAFSLQQELQACLRHLRSPVGRKNVAAVTKGFATTMNGLGIEIGRAFAKNLSARRS